jgi:hypothetical protein
MAAPAPKKRKRVPRSPDTGQFEGYTPFNDPVVLNHAVKTVRAIDHLEPVLRALATEDTDPYRAQCLHLLHQTLAIVRGSMLDALAVDKAALKEAVKPELQVARRTQTKGGE